MVLGEHLNFYIMMWERTVSLYICNWIHFWKNSSVRYIACFHGQYMPYIEDLLSIACFHGQYVPYIEDLLYRHQLNEHYPRSLDSQHQRCTGLPSASLCNPGLPEDHKPKTLKLSQRSDSGEWSLRLAVCFIPALCGGQECEFPCLLLFTFISLVTFNTEDLCGDFGVITLKLLFRKINQNHLGVANILLQNRGSVSSRLCGRNPLRSYLADQPTPVNQQVKQVRELLRNRTGKESYANSTCLKQHKSKTEIWY